jgi:ADP-heptose:LPS heptosyltransferase
MIISAGGLGDTVLFSQVVGRLASLALPDEPVTLLLRSDAKSMAFVFPPNFQIVTVDYAKLRDIPYRLETFKSLWNAHYRIVIHGDYLRHPDLDESLVKAAGVDLAYAMEPRASSKHDRRLLANRMLYSTLVETGPMVRDKMLRWFDFANAVTGGIEVPSQLRIAVDPARLERPTAVLQPFSAVKLKQFAPEVWVRIIKALPVGWDILVAGHPNDLDRNPEFQMLLSLDGVRFEGAPFKALAPILAAAKLVVSVDTACLHLAALVGAPTVCLGSAAYVGEIVPYAPEIAPDSMKVFHQPCPHQGCLGACVYPPERGMYPCVAALDGDEIEAWIKAHV